MSLYFFKKLQNNSLLKDNGCIEWIGAISSTGYGSLTYKQRRYTSHKISYTINYGKVPKGLCVLHKCDNRSCINPDHLFLGTLKDNVHDMMQKGRNNQAREFGNNNCKLSNQQVVDIRESYKTQKTSHRKLAKEYGVNHRVIGRIITGEARKHATLLG